jgi:zinc protease
MKVYRVDRVDFPNKSGRLTNGLRVVVQPDQSQPRVRVLVRYEIGAAYDPKEKKGIAHLVEHLAFRLGDELVEIDAAPQRSGSAERAPKKGTHYKTIRYVASENAYTTLDETVYWTRVAPPQLEHVLRDFADHWRWETHPEYLAYGIKFLSVYADQGLMLAAEVLSAPRFLRRKVNNTRDRLVQNLANADRDVDALAYRALLEVRGLERAEPVETTQSLQAIDRAAVADFHTGLFYPENVILTVTSDRPVAELEPLVRQYFGGWNASGKPGADIGAISPKGPAAGGGRIVVVPVDGASQSEILIGFDAPGWHDWQGVVASQAVSELLQTKLRRLRAAMGVTYGADVWTRTFRNAGTLNVSIKVDRTATDSATEQLLRIVDDLRREPVTEGELDFVRRRLISDYIGRGTTNSAIAAAHGDLMLKSRPTDYFGEVIAHLKKLELASLQAAVDARLGQPSTLVVVGQLPELPKERGGPLDRFSGEPVRYTPAELLD